MRITSDFTDYLFYIYIEEKKSYVTDTIVSENCFIIIDNDKRWIGIEYECFNKKKYKDTIYWKNCDKDISKLKQEMNFDFVDDCIYGIEILLWNENRFINFESINKISNP